MVLIFNKSLVRRRRYFHHANDYWTEHVGAYVDLYNETEETDWAGPAPAFAPLRSGPGYGYNGSCPEGDYPPNGVCGMTGPEEEYEEFKFKTRVPILTNVAEFYGNFVLRWFC